MPTSTVLRIALDLAPSDRGGRRRPLVDGYRASMSFGRRRRGIEPIVHDAILVLEDVSSLAPGGSATARAWVVLPDELPREAHEDAVFTLLENDRIIGRATILAVLTDDEPQPLRDLVAAKTRVLSAATSLP